MRHKEHSNYLLSFEWEAWGCHGDGPISPGGGVLVVRRILEASSVLYRTHTHTHIHTHTHTHTRRGECSVLVPKSLLFPLQAATHHPQVTHKGRIKGGTFGEGN